MGIKEEIKEALAKALKELDLAEVAVQIDHPTDESHGDYATNVALIAFGREKGKGDRGKWKNPIELAQAIVKPFTLYPSPFLDRIEVAPPGFINFWLSKKYMVRWLYSYIAAGDKTTMLDHAVMKGKRIMVEFTDPNPFKEFHIGHLYSNAVGESLCRLFEAQGAKVWRVNYQGDVGLHIAKSLYALLQKSNIKNQISKIENGSVSEKAKFLGEAYAAGAKAYEEDEKTKREINELNKKIYDHDPSVWEIYQKGRQWSLDYFETIYKRLGTKFNRYYFESEAGPVGLKLVREHIKDGVFKESDGAIIFEGKKHARLQTPGASATGGQGLHNRVFINSLGLPTYEAKDLGLPPTKYKDFPYDQSIIVTGNEIDVYFKVVLKALSMISPELAAKTRHLGHGMVRLAAGKMSSRTGQVLTGEWLLDEAKRRIRQEYQDMDDDTAEQVAVGAVKYALLRSSLGQDITFDFDKSITLEGDSGPYLQYAFARTQSVLSKSHMANGISKNDKRYAISNKLELEELTLLRSLHRFPEVVGEAAEKYAPNLLTTYLFDLAQKFNLFYQKHPILGDVGAVTDFRVALTAAVGQILKNGLNLLGISAPERM